MGQNLKNGVALFALATLSGLGMAQTALADPTTKWNGGPETREDDRRFHVNGRFQYDFEHQNDDRYPDAIARSFARRAFLGVDGRLSEHWRYNIKFDFAFGANGNATTTIPAQTVRYPVDTNNDGDFLDAGESTAGTLNIPSQNVTTNSNNDAIKADDFYLEYADDWGSIFIGQNNAVSPMEDRTSSLNIPFNERSMIIQALGFGKKPGVAFLTSGGNWSAGVAVQSNDAFDSADTSSGNESALVIGRGTFAPLYQQTPDGTMVLHLGVNSRFRDNGGGDQSATNTTAGSNFSYKSRTPGDAISTTGGDQAFSVGGTGQDFTYGFEAAFQYNNFGIEAEYQHLDTQGATNGGSTGLGSNDDASADGYYVDLFWSPTGESRSYKAADGSFGAIAPLRPLGSGGFGHVMLAARYEHVDFTDEQFGGTSGDVNGAVNPAGMTGRTEATSYTLGASWVPIEHVKFQLNYASTSIDDIGVGVADQDVNTISLRTQLDW